MNRNRTQLICTFTDTEKLDELVQRIRTNFEIIFGKMFVLSDPHGGLVCTYNITYDPNNKFIGESILVHRKKETNTIYTINALNELIIQHNDGMLNTEYRIDWNEYRNQIILTNGDGLQYIPTKVFKIFHFEN